MMFAFGFDLQQEVSENVLEEFRSKKKVNLKPFENNSRHIGFPFFKKPSSISEEGPRGPH